MLRSLGQELADFLFPPFCVACHATGDWWCADCRQKVQAVGQTICPQCLAIGGHACVGGWPFISVWASGYYHDPILRSAITALKFHGTFAIRRNLDSFLASQASLQLDADAALVPMPLSDKRLKERGFNQAELIAHAWRRTSCPQTAVVSCLKRVGHRDPQSSLGHELAERQANVKGCFAAEGPVPRHAVLVDDVVTTGATANEAAQVLLAAGAEKVSVLALAIGA